jgi:hypothetical protein
MSFIIGNTVVGTTGIVAPVFTNNNRPTNATTGYVIYNTDAQQLQGYFGNIGGQSGIWRTIGGNIATGSAYLYRTVITTGYVMGGYQNSSPWKNVNRMNHSTDVMTNLGDLLTNSGAYTSGTNNNSKGFIWSTDNSFPGSSTTTSAFSMITETGSGLNTNWNMRVNRNNMGTIFKETLYAYIVGGGNADVDVFNLTTETMLADFTYIGNYIQMGGVTPYNTPISGDTSSSDSSNAIGTMSDETAGYGYCDNGTFRLTFATSTVSGIDPARSGLSGDYYISGANVNLGAHGQQKGINSKLNRGYAGNEGNYNGGYNLRRWVFPTQTYTTISKPIGNSGEENFDMGQDHQYMMGCYDGSQNNRGWRFSYTTDTGYELGAGSVRTGVAGGSSGACCWKG